VLDLSDVSGALVNRDTCRQAGRVGRRAGDSTAPLEIELRTFQTGLPRRDGPPQAGEPFRPRADRDLVRFSLHRSTQPAIMMPHRESGATTESKRWLLGGGFDSRTHTHPHVHQHDLVPQFAHRGTHLRALAAVAHGFEVGAGADEVRSVAIIPEGLYGRRKLTVYLRRTSVREVAECTRGPSHEDVGHQGIRTLTKSSTSPPSSTRPRPSAAPAASAPPGRATAMVRECRGRCSVSLVKAWLMVEAKRLGCARAAREDSRRARAPSPVGLHVDGAHSAKPVGSGERMLGGSSPRRYIDNYAALHRTGQRRDGVNNRTCPQLDNRLRHECS